MAISSEQAFKIIQKKIRKLPAMHIGLLESLGYVLAQDIRAKIDVPPFDNSAMDGYAISEADINRKTQLTISGEIKAGSIGIRALKPGKAVSIMTGSAIPKGTAAVVPIENTINTSFSKRDSWSKEKVINIIKPVSKGANIRKKGEDIRKKDVVLKKGTIIKPIHTALAASIGVDKLKIYTKPKIALIVTGDEVVEPAEKLGKGQIYNSNRYLLESLLRFLEIKDISYRKVGDSLKDTVAVLKQELEESDIILTTGGISVGKYDFLKNAFKEIGAKCHFTKVRQKPGKPFSFFTFKNKPIFSLPGNPVAAAVCFEIYAKPAILMMSGYKDFQRKEVKAVLANTIKKKAGRKHWIRVNLIKQDGSYIAKPCNAQGSGILTSMLADGIAVIEEDKTKVTKGSNVKVILLDKECWG